ncbi:MAG: hypothetical protein LBL13_11120 [Bacteroidales bacterium]|nr:hypothetical protein [Bacteroidales bacterium]
MTLTIPPSLRGTKQSLTNNAWSEEGRMYERQITLTCSLVHLSTDNTPLSSLRGTKQSRTMKQKRAYKDKGCKALCTGILDCFASLAMTM